jgi:sugar-specific transcriptional regulator TrmB
MYTDMEKELKAFGLTDKEIKVYLACLKLGTALVQDIAKEAGTYRTYTYEVLKSLKEKGLVSYVIKSGKQYFEVARPNKLLNILKEKQQKIQKVMPRLQELYQYAVKKPKIEIYEGKEGIKTVVDDLIRTGKEILVYGSTKKQLKALHFYFPNYIKRRIKERIKIKVLTEQSKTTEKIKKKDKKELRETRFLPKGMEFPTVTNIYGNKVAILSLEKEFLGIIIESESIAKTQRMVFDMMWKYSVLYRKAYK